MTRKKATRRTFLETATASSLAGLLASGKNSFAQEVKQGQGGVADANIKIDAGIADIPVTLKPNGADVGSLYADVERLGKLHDFELSFLGDRFENLDEFKRQAREKVLEILLYRPQPVDPKPEVLSRTDLGDVIREKVVFSTTPEFRVPAYIHIPKGLTKPAPAILDLHSHGGMYVFGKEKVTDLGKNHPSMEEYHATSLRRTCDRHGFGSTWICGHHDRRLYVWRAENDSRRRYKARFRSVALQRRGRQ